MLPSPHMIGLVNLCAVIIAASAPCEGLFSKSELLISDRRSSLTIKKSRNDDVFKEKYASLKIIVSNLK